MKKKGFTLVELLAVIAILAILVIIAMPNVLDMFNKAKKDAFETEVKTIIKTTEKQWISDSMGKPGVNETIYCRVDGVDCENSLKMDGNKEIDYFVKVNSKGKIIQLATVDDEYQYLSNKNDIKSSDEIISETLSDLEENQKISISSFGVIINGKLINNGSSSITIKAGQVIEELNLCAFDSSDVTFNIEEGAIIKKVFVQENGECKEIEVNEWYKRVKPKNISTLSELKTAISSGYRNIVSTATLNITGSESISSSYKIKISTKDKITLFNISSGATLTLKNVIIDGKNNYIVTTKNSENISNNPFSTSVSNSRIYIKTPLIETSGTLILNSGTVIKNYANRESSTSSYGSPAINSTSGSITINGLEFTNNISQLLVAKNTKVTIDNMNVHNTWTTGNKAGIIEIKSGSMMDVNNITVKNNIMSIRSYGLFIAASGTINMKGGIYENNYATKNGSNTAGSLFGIEEAGKIYMTGGSIINNIGYRAGAFATRWTSSGSIIEINGGIIKNNKTRNTDFKNASIFVQSDVKIGKNAIIEDKVVLRGATAVLDNYATINADVELVNDTCTFNNYGTVTGQIIKP